MAIKKYITILTSEGVGLVGCTCLKVMECYEGKGVSTILLQRYVYHEGMYFASQAQSTNFIGKKIGPTFLSIFLRVQSIY